MVREEQGNKALEWSPAGSTVFKKSNNNQKKPCTFFIKLWRIVSVPLQFSMQVMDLFYASNKNEKQYWKIAGMHSFKTKWLSEHTGAFCVNA